MITNKTLLAIAVATVASAAFADTTVTLTGSTAFRSVIFDRVPNAVLQNVLTVNDSAGSTSYRSYIGTVSGHPEYGNVTIRMSFNGSLEGIDALNNNTGLTVLTNVTYSGSTGTTTAARSSTPAIADAAFSDVFVSTSGRSGAKFAPDVQ